jgi:hypothetical protein
VRSSTLTTVLTVISCLVIVLATIAVGLQQTLLNTDRWVAVVGPLASDPQVESSVAAATTAMTMNAVQSRTQALPGPLSNLAAPVESALSTAVNNVTTQLVQSPQFAALWVSANRAIHQALVQLLRGGDLSGSGAVKVDNGQVEVNLLMLTPALLDRLQQGAASAILSQLPSDFGYVSIAQASTLATLQRAVQALDSATLRLVLAAPILVVVTLIVSPHRRRTIICLGIGVALGMLIVAVPLLLAQGAVLTSLGNQPITGAVQAAMNAVVVSIGVGMLVVFVVAVAAALIAWFTGRRVAPPAYSVS